VNADSDGEVECCPEQQLLETERWPRRRQNENGGNYAGREYAAEHWQYKRRGNLLGTGKHLAYHLLSLGQFTFSKVK
jgi:hypothetical protein